MVAPKNRLNLFRTQLVPVRRSGRRRYCARHWRSGTSFQKLGRVGAFPAFSSKTVVQGTGIGRG